ncbi:unnamed protein product [Oikopleura dioica]|uniref:Nuclear transcription factor Y subunit gamma n=1 Tax=Oikopleura dioica TaxID=34765 RepID=E4XU77_OIKDI|nr:unnamed protein product [Oikopleura dioica]
MINQEQQQPQQSDMQQALAEFWQHRIAEMRSLRPDHFKQQELPLARIKKIMKIDEDVRMISSEAPLLFAKAAQVFINELTLRAWIHTEDSKRRTLQRNDIAMAVHKFDQFDFLIDIVPRDEIHKQTSQSAASVVHTTPSQPMVATSGAGGQTYYVTLTASELNGNQQVVIQNPQ